MDPAQPLACDRFYHIYNRGTNGETLFREERNYRYFLDLYARHVEPVAETYAYCLVLNHFHLLVRIRPEIGSKIGPVSETGPILSASRQFNNLFIAYAKAVNKTYGRTGALFESPFHRKPVESERYFTALVVYIHHNPQLHGIVADFRDWPHSSYRAIRSQKPTHIRRDEVLSWFDGPAGFEATHRDSRDWSSLRDWTNLEGT